jgi:hypothetical protein
MLRRRSKAVSKYSQHMAGRAMDLFLPGVDIARVRATAMRLEHGGVGFYPSSADSFIHLDVGSVRAWPRMSRGQLLALFPDGKTVHLPNRGPPLARYEEARAELLARGATVRSVSYASADGTRHASAEPPATAARGFPRSEQGAIPGSALALAPMPPRPEEMTALSPFALPPGPSFPVEIASAGTIPLAARTDATEGFERRAEVTAASDLHLPVSRKAGAAADDKAQLRALFVAALTRVDAGVDVKVAMARVRTQADAPSGLIAESAPGFSLRFSARPGDELRNRFTGPAVKLPSLLR